MTVSNGPEVPAEILDASYQAVLQTFDDLDVEAKAHIPVKDQSLAKVLAHRVAQAVLREQAKTT